MMNVCGEKVTEIKVFDVISETFGFKEYFNYDNCYLGFLSKKEMIPNILNYGRRNCKSPSVL